MVRIVSASRIGQQGRQLPSFPHPSRDNAATDAYSPISLPRISFMIGERGTAGHAGSSGGKESLQMSLFGEEGDDRD